MHTFTLLASFLAVALTTASPIEKRVSTPAVNDGIIVRAASCLKALEISNMN